MHRGEVKLVALDQQNAGLDAAKLHRNTMDNSVEELVELKYGADFLRRLLHGNQNVHAALLEHCRAGTKRRSRMTGSSWHGKGLHRTSILDSRPVLRMRKAIPGRTTISVFRVACESRIVRSKSRLRICQTAPAMPPARSNKLRTGLPGVSRERTRVSASQS